MITVVTGPPCSGKSTYVRTHAKPGDIVIDFDTMAQAFGSPHPHDHGPAVKHVTQMARRAAIQAAVTVHQHTGVWIVDCNISAERLGLYRKAGASIVALPYTLAELHKRASKERPTLWHRLIDEWCPTVDAQPAETMSGSRHW